MRPSAMLPSKKPSPQLPEITAARTDVLAYLAGQAMAQVVRANTILFLAALDVVIVANLLAKGVVDWALVALALALAIPYVTTSLIGQALFDPRHERLYRWVAYAVIALAVLSGLPIWSNGA